MNNVFSDIVEETKLLVEDTPNLLLALNDAGVCDSAAQGLLYFFEEMLEAIDGKQLEDGFSTKNDKSKTLKLKTKKESYINTEEKKGISEECFGY